jgi:hypothetical protein
LFSCDDLQCKKKLNVKSKRQEKLQGRYFKVMLCVINLNLSIL